MPRRTHFQLICSTAGSLRGGRPPGPTGPPDPPPPGGGRRGGTGGGGLCGGVPSSAAFTASIGSRSGRVSSSRTAGMIAVRRSSKWLTGLRSGRGRSTSTVSRSSTPSAACPLWTSLADRLWRPSLFTGRPRTIARGPGRTRALRGPNRAEHVGLHQVIPAAGPAYLHHVYRELVVAGGQQDQLLGGARRTLYRAEVIAEDPGHQRELFLAADRTHHRTGLPVIFRGSQQIGIRVADLRDTGAPRVDLRQQGPPPKRVVHHLSLQSHDDQSTSAPSAWKRDGVRWLARRHLSAAMVSDLLRSSSVATGRPGGTRAKDSDRTATCQILDSAFAEGQLSMEEHRQRVSAATNAPTLGELESLVADLQTAGAVKSPSKLWAQPNLKRRPSLPKGAGWGLRL